MTRQFGEIIRALVTVWRYWRFKRRMQRFVKQHPFDAEEIRRAMETCDV